MDRPRAKPIPPPIKGNVQKARLDNSSNFASLDPSARKILRGFSSKLKFEISPTIFSGSTRDTIVPSFVKISHRQLRNRKFLSQNFLLRTKAGKFSQRERGEPRFHRGSSPLARRAAKFRAELWPGTHVRTRVYTLVHYTHIYIYIRNGLKIQVTEAPCSGSRV